MESAIWALCKSLSSTCNTIQSASSSLSDSVKRPPVPLESSTSAFLKSLDRKIASTSGDLNQLESMAFGTVSFEELLGHCNEVYKLNHKCISDIEDQMTSFGYVPEIEIEDPNYEMDLKEDNASPDFKGDKFNMVCGSVSVARARRRLVSDHAVFEESMSLKNLGLSDACLATLSCTGGDYFPSSPNISQKLASFEEEQTKEMGTTNDQKIRVSKDDYDNLPAYMKSLATWEELNEVVTKLNSFFADGKENEKFSQDETEKLGLGRKGRSYLLMLLKLNRLMVETLDGSNYYQLNVANP